MGLNVRYATEVDCSCGIMSDKEYESLMQSLNQEQSEICIHIMEWIQTKTEPLHIFIEGGAGVGKTCVAKTIYQSMERFSGSQPGENPDRMCCMVLAPTGMASYHVKGNTLHSGLHIDLNEAKPTPLGNSEKNTLHAKYFKTKAVFYDEMSMVGRELFNKSEYRFREIFGIGMTFGDLHVIVVGDFFQMAPVRDSYVFKDDFKDYGPLSPNLWKDHFYIYTLTEIMHQKDEKQFCEVLNRLRIGELMESDNALFMSRIVKKSDSHYV